MISPLGYHALKPHVARGHEQVWADLALLERNDEIPIRPAIEQRKMLLACRQRQLPEIVTVQREAVEGVQPHLLVNLPECGPWDMGPPFYVVPNRVKMHDIQCAGYHLCRLEKGNWKWSAGVILITAHMEAPLPFRQTNSAAPISAGKNHPRDVKQFTSNRRSPDSALRPLRGGIAAHETKKQVGTELHALLISLTEYSYPYGNISENIFYVSKDALL